MENQSLDARASIYPSVEWEGEYLSVFQRVHANELLRLEDERGYVSAESYCNMMAPVFHSLGSCCILLIDSYLPTSLS